MTQEEKSLLLQDLCARLPYGVICNDNRHGSSRVTNIDITPDDIEPKNGKVVVYYFDFDECGELKNCRPYLRPMSSMTKKEEKELEKIIDGILGYKARNYFHSEDDYKWNTLYETIGWLNSHHFDYRGLIEKGLAWVAPEGMYK